MNTSIFHGLGCSIYDHEYFKPSLLARDKAALLARCNNPEITTIWGQTTHENDWVFQQKEVPQLETGDWLMFRNIGAYNKDLECAYEDFDLPDHVYIC